ncbi:MAG: amidohydrolase family protein [Myxococcota bacterium]
MRCCVLALLTLTLACRGSAPAGVDASRGSASDGGTPGATSYSRIDVHVHADPRLYPLVFRILNRVGVERLVNLSGGPPGEGLEGALTAAIPYGNRVLTCTNLQWQHLVEQDFAARMVADLERARALGAVCLKVPKALGLGIRRPGEQLMRVDDERLDRVWQAAGRLGMPVFIHVADPAAFWLPATPQNERYDELRIHPAWSFADPRFPPRSELLHQFENLLARHPGTTFVGVHFGNDPEDVDATDRRMDAHKNLWIDTAARVPEIGRRDPERLRAFFLKHQDRVLFGTDLGVTGGGIMLGSTDGTEPKWPDIARFFALHWRFFEGSERNIPHPTPIQGRWTVNAVGLPPEVLRKFYADNAMRLLKWPELMPVAPGALEWPPKGTRAP